VADRLKLIGLKSGFDRTQRDADVARPTGVCCKHDFRAASRLGGRLRFAPATSWRGPSPPNLPTHSPTAYDAWSMGAMRVVPWLSLLKAIQAEEIQ